jgi:hypothetical protein
LEAALDGRGTLAGAALGSVEVVDAGAMNFALEAAGSGGDGGVGGADLVEARLGGLASLHDGFERSVKADEEDGEAVEAAGAVSEDASALLVVVTDVGDDV